MMETKNYEAVSNGRSRKIAQDTIRQVARESMVHFIFISQMSLVPCGTLINFFSSSCDRQTKQHHYFFPCSTSPHANSTLPVSSPLHDYPTILSRVTGRPVALGMSSRRKRPKRRKMQRDVDHADGTKRKTSFWTARQNFRKNVACSSAHKGFKNKKRHIACLFTSAFILNTKLKSSVNKFSGGSQNSHKAITDERYCYTAHGIRVKYRPPIPSLLAKWFVDPWYRFPVRAFYCTPKQVETMRDQRHANFQRSCRTGDIVFMKTAVG